MPKTKIPSPARSQGALLTPRRNRSRRCHSVTSQAPSNASVRLTALLKFNENDMDSLVLSPMNSRVSVLTDNTEVEEPRRKSWWKKLDENCRDVLDVLDNEVVESNDVLDELDIEVLSQEKKNYTLELPNSSDNESVSSIVLPQRKLFNQKENVPRKQNKFGQLVGTRESMSKTNKTIVLSPEETLNVDIKTLFGQRTKITKPIFPAGLLNRSNKTIGDKTIGMLEEPRNQVRNIFNNRPATKRKNMYAEFVMSESEDEIPEIQPIVFAFQKKVETRVNSTSRNVRQSSLTPNVTTEIEMDEWMMLPSSTMVENQLEDFAAGMTPVKKARLSKFSQAQRSKMGSSIEVDAQPKHVLHKSTDKLRRPSYFAEKRTIDDEIQSEDVNHESIIDQEQIIREADEEADDDDNNFTLTYDDDNKPTESDENEDAVDKQTNVKSVEYNETLTHEAATNDKEINVHNKMETSNIKDKLNNQSKSQIKEGMSELRRQNKSIEQNIEDEIENEQNDEPEESHKQIDMDENNADYEIHNDQQNVEGEMEIDQQEKNASEVKVQNDFIDENEKQNKSQVEASNDHNDSNVEQQNDSVDEQNESHVEASNDHNDSEVGQQNDSDDEQNESQVEASNDQNDSNVEQQNDSVDEQNESQVEASNDQNDSNVEQQNDSVDEQNESQVEASNYQNDSNVEQQNDSVDEQNESQVEAINDHNDSKMEQQNDSENENDDKQNESQVEASNDHNDSYVEHQNGSENENDDEQNESHVEVSNNQNDSEVEQQNDSEDEQNEFQDEASNDQIDSEVEQQNDSKDEQYESHVEVSNKQNESDVEENDEQDMGEDDIDNVEENENYLVIEAKDDNQEIENESGKQAIEGSEEIEGTLSTSHDTTGRNRKKNETQIRSPEAVLATKTHQLDSFTAHGRNTSIRKTKSIRNLNASPSLATIRGSIDTNETKDSSAEGSGWDSHRTTRKTLRQTFGKDFTIRKSLRTLVMEKSAKRHTEFNEESADMPEVPQVNSTEFHDSYHDAEEVVEESETIEESDHEASKIMRQKSLEEYLQEVKKRNTEERIKIKEAYTKKLQESLEAARVQNQANIFKVPARPLPRKPAKQQSKPKTKERKLNLPAEILEDMKYKPPKRFRPNNASWLTKSLYKFLETKLELRYDYKARVRAEKLAETIYNFTKDLRRHQVAPPDMVHILKHEMARLDIVRTHFDFYEFFHDFMPREVRIKVVPDLINKIPLPKHGVFTDIL